MFISAYDYLVSTFSYFGVSLMVIPVLFILITILFAFDTVRSGLKYQTSDVYSAGILSAILSLAWPMTVGVVLIVFVGYTIAHYVHKAKTRNPDRMSMADRFSNMVNTMMASKPEPVEPVVEPTTEPTPVEEVTPNEEPATDSK